jgi:hypothetical protein
MFLRNYSKGVSMKIAVSLAAIAATIAFASPAQATDYGVVIHPGVQTVPNPNGGTVSAYDAVGEQGGGGYTAVTTSAPRGAAGTSGANGSLEIHGDRSRYVIGNIYENGVGGGASPSMGALSDVASLTFDWQTAVATASQIHAAPVVRLHIMDNGIRSEMIWEQVYNGGASGVQAAPGWHTSGASDAFYLNVRDHDGAAFLAQNSGLGLSVDGGDQGVVLKNGGQLNLSINDWKSYFSGNAFITGVSFGAGSGFGSNFVGYIDNVRGTTVGGDVGIVNFEAVPEPATWAMMIGGFAFVGAAARRRKTKVVFA